MRDDYSGDELRRLASAASNGEQTRRLMALAAICDGKNRTQAAAVGLMDRQTLRDWVIRFNEEGPEGWSTKSHRGVPPNSQANKNGSLSK
jgi:transposase-like protein